MRKTFLRERERAARLDLLTIDEEQAAQEIRECYNPFRTHADPLPNARSLIRKKAKTEVSSPDKNTNSRRALKENL